MIAPIKYWRILNKEAENKILEICSNTCGQIKSGGLENPYGQFTCPPLKARKYVACSVPLCLLPEIVRKNGVILYTANGTC
jgi:hypothetical protein